MTRPETYSDRDVLIGVVVAGVFVFVISGLVGHFGAPSGSRWELTSILGTALGTTLLAGATGFLAYSTRSDVRATVRLANISQAALDAQVQPVLVDVVLGSGPVGATDFVAYEPGVADGSRVIAHEVVEVSALGSGHFVCSVPLRNAGAGLAVITEEPRLDHPSRDVDYIGRLTTQIVPPRRADPSLLRPRCTAGDSRGRDINRQGAVHRRVRLDRRLLVEGRVD